MTTTARGAEEQSLSTAPSALAVALWFVHQAHAGQDNDLTHLKLQKLLYYAQGWRLALFGRAAFGDPVEAWQHGPVVPAVYHAYKHYRDETISRGVPVQDEVVEPSLGSLLGRVWDHYGQFSAGKLRSMTHRERPWITFYTQGGSAQIPESELADFFARHAPDELEDPPTVFEDVRPIVVSGDQWPALRKLAEHHGGA